MNRVEAEPRKSVEPSTSPAEKILALQHADRLELGPETTLGRAPDIDDLGDT
jgi:hypothetical protein